MECAAVVTRGKRVPTVMLDMAHRVNNAAQWAEKVQMQPTPQELPAITAVFLGYARKAKIERDTRWMEFFDQNANLFIKAGDSSGRVFALPVMPGDRFHVGALMLSRIEAQYAGMGAGLVLAALRGAFIKSHVMPEPANSR